MSMCLEARYKSLLIPPMNSRGLVKLAVAARLLIELLGKGHQDHDGVVDVGIEIVGIFEAPAPGRCMNGFTPIACRADFALEQPVHSAGAARAIGAALSGGQRPQGNRGIPNRRFTRLQPGRVTL